MYASSGAIMHLLVIQAHDSNDFSSSTKLRSEHVKWISGRDVTEQKLKTSMLLRSLGGVGPPSYEVSPVTLFTSPSLSMLAKARRRSRASVGASGWLLNCVANNLFTTRLFG